MATVQMLITFDTETKQVAVDGPTHELILCYGMLERAKDALRNLANKKTEEPKIVVASDGALKSLPKIPQKG
jgi:hypothetical protein